MAADDLPEGTDPNDPYLDPVEHGAEIVTDLVVVDGQTGVILDMVHRGGSGLWTVKVVNLAPHTSDLGLKGPTLVRLFDGAKSTAAGYVEFFQIKLGLGVYTVYQATALGHLVVVTFNVVSLSTTSSSSSSGQPNVEGEAAECIERVTYQRIIARQARWTPLLIASSPYYGSTEATSAFTDAKATFVLGWGYWSRLQTGPGLDVYSGHTKGVFQLVEWSQIQQSVQRANCSTYFRWTYAITDDAPTGSHWTDDFDLTGNSLHTSADDKTTVSRHGYESVKFDFRYRRPANRNIDTTDGGYSWTTGSGSGNLWSAGLDIGFQHPNSPVGVSAGAYRGERESGVTSSYTYDFPGGERWNATYFGGDKGIWSFCYRYGQGAC